MGQRIALVAAWLAGTLVAVIIASAAVGAVRGEVTDQPQSADPFLPSTTAPAPTTSPPTTSMGSTTTGPTTTVTTSTTVASTSTTTTTPAGSTTTTSLPSGSSTTTSSTTPTTSPGAPTRLPPYQLTGGTVTIEVLDPYVWLVGAVPAVGYTVEVEYSGPDEVEVEFESEDAESKFRASWDDGRLVIDIEDD